MAEETRRSWVVLAACATAALAPQVSNSVLSQAAEAVRRELAASDQTMQLITSVGRLVFASVILASGAAGDLYGRRRLLLVGAAGMAGSALLCAVAPSAGFVLAGRVLDGLFATFVSALSLGIVALGFSERTRPLAIGVFSGLISLADLAGPWAAGWIVEALHWRVAFALIAGCAGVGAVAVVWWVPKSESASRDCPLDLSGAALSTAGLLALAYGVIDLGACGPRTTGLLALALGVLGILAFARREFRVAAPLLDLRLLRRPALATAVLAGFVTSFVGAGLFLPFLYYFRTVRGTTAPLAALALLPAPLAVAIISPLAGRLASVVSARIQMGGGLLLAATGALALAWIREDTPYPALAAALAVIGCGVAMVNTRRTAVILSGLPPEAAGAAAALGMATSKLGAALGNTGLIALFSTFARQQIRTSLAAPGLTPAAIEARFEAWRRLHHSAAYAGEGLPADLLAQITTSYQAAYSRALGQAEFVAAALCLGAALVVLLFRLTRVAGED